MFREAKRKLLQVIFCDIYIYIFQNFSYLEKIRGYKKVVAKCVQAVLVQFFRGGQIIRLPPTDRLPNRTDIDRLPTLTD
jgi:hypothetical protein